MRYSRSILLNPRVFLLAAAAGLPVAGAAFGAPLPALGGADANAQAAIDSHATLPPGPDPRTLRLDRLGDAFPDHGPATDAAAAAAVSHGTLKIPTWTAKVTSLGQNYNFTMVGASVLGKNAGTTNVKLVVVPLRFVFTNGTLDATTPIKGCSPAGAATMIAGSPLFGKVKLTLGRTYVGDAQYIDLFQRANFWSYTGGGANPNYHLQFNATQTPVVSITVNGPASAATCATGAAGGMGTLSFSAWDQLVQKTLIPQLAKYINPGVLPVFLSYNVVFGGAAGYHNAFATAKGTQTYAVSTYLDLAGAPPDSEVLSHELGEWVDDPLVTNPTPAWGHTGQVSKCQSNLEVGDPLTGMSYAHAKMPNGYTYTVQDLTFFSWFYRGSPSIGVNQQYTLFNYFSGVQAVCH